MNVHGEDPKNSILGSVLTFKYGKSLPERVRDPGMVPVYGSNGVVGTHTESLTEGPAIIIGRKGSIGEVHFSLSSCWPIDTTYYVDDFEGQEPFYWYWCLKSLRLGALDRATAIPGLNREDAYRLPVYMPSLEEQRRIVAKLDSLLGSSNSARDELRHIPKLVDRYKKIILATAFSGELSRQDFSKIMQPISQVVRKLDQGWSPKCENFASEDPKDWAVIKTTAIQPISFLPSENKVLPQSLAPRPHIEIEPGDVLITRAGPRSRVGITCVVKATRPRLMLADKVYRLKLQLDLAEPAFVALILNSPQALQIIESMKTGISDSGLNLTQGKFLRLPIPIPSLAEQREIVQRVEASFSRLHELLIEVSCASALLDRLDQAMLAKAFRGELLAEDTSEQARAKAVAPTVIEGPQAELRKQVSV